MIEILTLAFGIIAWMVIGAWVSIKFDTDPHEQFYTFLFQSLVWPFILYIEGWQVCIDWVGKKLRPITKKLP